MQRTLFWALFGLTMTVYALMLTWSLPTVSAAAGGLAPFDMRPGGYSFAGAEAFLTALSAEGAGFYRNVQLRLDIAYPALIALTLFFAIAALAPGKLGRWRYALALPALPVAVFDYLENHAVAAMIDAGRPGLTPEMVAGASGWTVQKSTMTTVAMSILLVLLLLKLARALPGLWRRAANWTRAHPVVAFLVLAYPIGWAAQYVSVQAGLSMFAASAIGTALGLALPAVAVTAVAGGGAAVIELLRRAVRLRTGARWYFAAIFGLMLAMILAGAIIDGGQPVAKLLGEWPRIATEFLPEMLAALLLIQLAEELGWTGFLQHRLQERHGALRATLMVAPAFALSHLMVNYLGAGDWAQAAAMLGVQVVFAVFFRTVITWLYNGAGQSVVIAALFHVAFNLSNGALMADLVGGAEAQMLALGLVAAAAVAILAATRGRPAPEARTPATGTGTALASAA